MKEGSGGDQADEPEKPSDQVENLETNDKISELEFALKELKLQKEEDDERAKKVRILNFFSIS